MIKEFYELYDGSLVDSSIAITRKKEISLPKNMPSFNTKNIYLEQCTCKDHTSSVIVKRDGRVMYSFCCENFKEKLFAELINKVS